MTMSELQKFSIVHGQCWKDLSDRIENFPPETLDSLIVEYVVPVFTSECCGSQRAHYSSTKSIKLFESLSLTKLFSRIDCGKK